MRASVDGRSAARTILSWPSSLALFVRRRWSPIVDHGIIVERDEAARADWAGDFGAARDHGDRVDRAGVGRTGEDDHTGHHR
jgi:hypothetical protein